MRLSYERNSRLKAELNWFQSRRSHWDAAITQTQSGSQKKAFNKFRFATKIEHWIFWALSIWWKMTHAHIAFTQLNKKHTHLFDSFFFVLLRLDFFQFSKRNSYFIWICVCVYVCALCWWTFYLWIVYVAKFKTCDENLNAAWTAAMKWGKKREDRKKTRKNKKKGIE